MKLKTEKVLIKDEEKNIILKQLNIFLQKSSRKSLIKCFRNFCKKGLMQ